MLAKEDRSKSGGGVCSACDAALGKEGKPQQIVRLLSVTVRCRANWQAAGCSDARRDAARCCVKVRSAVRCRAVLRRGALCCAMPCSAVLWRDAVRCRAAGYHVEVGCAERGSAAGRDEVLRDAAPF
jgi:hypothetical protein